MTLTRKSFLIILSFFIAACGSISNERTSDASAVSASASGAYSDQGITSSNILYFAYDFELKFSHFFWWQKVLFQYH